MRVAGRCGVAMPMSPGIAGQPQRRPMVGDVMPADDARSASSSVIAGPTARSSEPRGIEGGDGVRDRPPSELAQSMSTPIVGPPATVAPFA